ncbi:MAG: guanylate kinase [Alphaproteobacteria bacterium]|nr:guanylate kinase [Alphaproteobacteria bacterium]
MRTIFVISGPAGAGKTVVIDAMRQAGRGLPLARPINSTSRDPRHDEIPGVSYHFFTPEAFKRKIEAGDFVEWAIVHGEYKGLLRDSLNDVPIDKDILISLDNQGFHNIKKSFNADEFKVVGIFIEAPSMKVLLERMVMRGADPESESTKTRLKTAEEEMADRFSYDYVVMNDDLGKCFNEVENIIRANLTQGVSGSLFD